MGDNNRLRKLTETPTRKNPPLRCFVTFMPVPTKINPTGWAPVEVDASHVETGKPDWKCIEMVDIRRERAAIAQDLLDAAQKIKDPVRREVMLNISKLITERHTMDSASGPAGEI